ncbi:hypothetical protein KPC_3590 [Acinetobacter stercoris]|uniref:Uncharacterized protein n=1 Tax=Acinetobacter stercoris TaxID=2126983 RepID=A0A2U3N429_9GAMM|nr:hypothetical protein KPC_3590 [Acinetobacter stercoris]
MSAFSTLSGTQSNVTTYVRILDLPPISFLHEIYSRKAFDKMGGYLYHIRLQISKSF